MFELENVNTVDSIVFDLINKEVSRQDNTIELIASENHVSKAVMAAAGTPLTNKYADGYPGERMYGGCEFVDEIETLAIERAKKLFNCKYANVQPYSGSQANMAVVFAMLEKDDTVLSMDVFDGGHDTHGTKTNYTGRYVNAYRYEVDESGLLDYDNIRKLAKQHKPKLIFAGASAYPREIDFEIFGDIAKEVGAILVADIAHIAGLVASGLHKSPFPYADIVTSTTHKTLRGPRGGIILTNDSEIAEKIDKAVFPGSQGCPLMHLIASKAIAFNEALDPSFKDYSKNIISNAKILSKTFIENGLEVLTGGTDNHLLILDVTSIGLTGEEAEKMLAEVNISAGANPFSTKDIENGKTVSGLRLGTPAITTRGFKQDDVIELGEIIIMTLKNFNENKDNAKHKVNQLLKKYPLNY